ncbi:MAG: hypothetical protein PG981_001412 [Wolbachia endosymbiont of Ctenocephalides orientis wCori]|nr:MAG: hypothetical protein PG981_001412 [Wolbachia endosymbiont of Ctenocephalides orientis wCori]
MLFGKCDNFPTFHVLSNKYLEERRRADNRIRTCDSAICVFVTVCAVGLLVTYPNIGFAIAIGIVALTVAIAMSGLARGYIEEKFQKKMSIELESEKTSESASTISSDIETQELQAKPQGELEIDELETEELTESRGRQ